METPEWTSQVQSSSLPGIGKDLLLRRKSLELLVFRTLPEKSQRLIRETEVNCQLCK